MKRSSWPLLFIFIFLFSCGSKGFDGEVILHWNDTSPRNEDVKVIEQRLKKIGIKKYTIQVINDKTIKVEAKNIRDTVKFVQLLESNVELGFWETYENSEAFTFLDDLNRRLGVGVSLYNPNEPGLTQNDSAQMRVNPLWSHLQVALNTDEKGRQVLRPGPETGWCKDIDTAFVDSLLRIGTKTIFPKDLALFWTLKPLESNNPESNAPNDIYGLIALRKYFPTGGAFMTQAFIQNSEIEKDNNGNKSLTIKFDKEGTKLWEKMTRKNIGRSIAITIDGRVVSYPHVEGVISGGKASITGPDPEELKIIQMSSQMIPFKTRPRISHHHFEKKEK